MFNLLKRYLKDYWAQMLLIAVFTVGQAYTQTSLPVYLNDIIKAGNHKMVSCFCKLYIHFTQAR